MQVTYSGEGVFISLGLVCSTQSTTPESLAENFRSAIYAFSKVSLYGAVSSSSSSGSTTAINAAVYVVAKAWYRSIAVSSSVVLADSLNNFAQPARPQTLEDVFNGPYFVQKVSAASDFNVMVAVIVRLGAHTVGSAHLESAKHCGTGSTQETYWARLCACNNTWPAAAKGF
jgi:hypothetical protein